MTDTRRALISVSDKNHVADFAKLLLDLSFEIVSTGGTAKVLREAGIPVVDVAELTGFPEIMGGRVKTLHPVVHGGLLARPQIDDNIIAQHGITPFDLLVVNLYPFEKVISKQDVTLADAIENIDIGGPAMLRAAAKNHARVTVAVDSADYNIIADAFRSGGPSIDLKRNLAAKAFAHTARYDSLITAFLGQQDRSAAAYPDTLVKSWDKAYDLRYGENPHQHAAVYRDKDATPGSVAWGSLLQGKPLSYNNLLDTDTAVQCAGRFSGTACVIVKHMNPCGVAVAENIGRAYEAALATDPTSAFGGIIAFNRPLDAQTAKTIIDRQHLDVLTAPSIDADALTVLAAKRNLRVIETGEPLPTRDGGHDFELRSIAGGLLAQQTDNANADHAQLDTVTRREPTDNEVSDLRFAWAVTQYVKSNAIVYAKNNRTLGIGAGQTSRVMSARIAGLKAADEQLAIGGAVMASDAFLPFRDGLDTAAGMGIRAVIQPGGSVRDQEVIDAANEHGIAMVFTGRRHFRH